MAIQGYVMNACRAALHRHGPALSVIALAPISMAR